ncbi:MAG: hypothetical protein K8R99_03895 [Actinomycetia bacterium]|nr:hypothetical protein [Actinomycetes bacterium]
MCFSAQADVVGGVVVSAIGVDVLRHIRGRRRHVALAALPLMLGLHQLDEAFVWWGLQGHVSEGVGRVATWLYLLFAFVVLPIFVPAAVMLLEPKGRRRQAMGGLVVLGIGVSGVLLAAMIRGPVTATLNNHNIAYETDLKAGVLVVMAYVVATCGSLLLSSHIEFAIFGIVNLVAVAVFAKLTIDGFASLWCAWAAIASAALAIHMRYGRTPTSRRWDVATGGYGAT